MVSFNQVINGVTRYIDEEILSKISDWRKWVLGAAVGIGISRSTDMFNQLKQTPIIKAMKLVDENDMIDIDTIYTEVLKQAQKGAITFEVPALGALTLNHSDVEKMYQFIKGAV